MTIKMGSQPLLFSLVACIAYLLDGVDGGSGLVSLRNRGARRMGDVLSSASPALPEAESAWGHTALSAALAAVDDYVEGDMGHAERKADATGSLGMPAKHKHIVIDGLSVAFAHGGHKRFSIEGIEICLAFWAEKGYTNVVAFVPYKYSQEIKEGSARTMTGDNIERLKELNTKGLVQFTPSGASDGGILTSFAQQKGGFVVSNSAFEDWKQTCSSEEAAWMKHNHIYFAWLGGKFVPICDYDHKGWDGDSGSKHRSHGHEGIYGGEYPVGWVRDDEKGADAAGQEQQQGASLQGAGLPGISGGGTDATLLTPSELLEVLGGKNLDRMDSATLKNLVRVTENASHVLFLESHIGVVSSMETDSITVDDCMLAEPSFIPPGCVAVGDSAEIDAVWDAACDVWRVTRLVRTACIAEREAAMAPALLLFASLMGYASVEDLQAAWQESGCSLDTSHPASCMRGMTFTTRHLHRNQAYRCVGLSVPSHRQHVLPHLSMLTVCEFFSSKYAPLRYPEMPCLIALASDGSTPLYFPLEACRVESSHLSEIDFPPPSLARLPAWDDKQQQQQQQEEEEANSSPDVGLGGGDSVGAAACEEGEEYGGRGGLEPGMDRTMVKLGEMMAQQTAELQARLVDARIENEMLRRQMQKWSSPPSSSPRADDEGGEARGELGEDAAAACKVEEGSSGDAVEKLKEGIQSRDRTITALKDVMKEVCGRHPGITGLVQKRLRAIREQMLPPKPGDKGLRG